MKRGPRPPVRCSQCGSETSASKWFDLGWIKVEQTYTDGNKWRSYTCSACREKNAAEYAAEMKPK